MVEAENQDKSHVEKRRGRRVASGPANGSIGAFLVIGGALLIASLISRFPKRKRPPFKQDKESQEESLACKPHENNEKYHSDRSVEGEKGLLGILQGSPTSPPSPFLAIPLRPSSTITIDHRERDGSIHTTEIEEELNDGSVQEEDRHHHHHCNKRFAIQEEQEDHGVRARDHRNTVEYEDDVGGVEFDESLDKDGREELNVVSDYTDGDSSIESSGERIHHTDEIDSYEEEIRTDAQWDRKGDREVETSFLEEPGAALVAMATVEKAHSYAKQSDGRVHYASVLMFLSAFVLLLLGYRLGGLFDDYMFSSYSSS